MIEAVVTGLVWLGLLVALRSQRELQLLVTGVVLMVFAWFALRAVH